MSSSVAVTAHGLLGSGFVLRLVVGTVLGFIIGLERELRHRAAGLQTSALVCVASTMYATISPSAGHVNDYRIVANIVTGVGFLAGGVILKDGANVKGLNTAATMWAAAAVGALAGIGMIAEAAAGALVILVLNSGVGVLVDYIDRKFRRDEIP
jgi:putative Mg2+ transporter-C (MgtC) family protein